MKPISIAIALMALLICSSACKKIPCQDNGPVICLEGYDSTELRKVTATKFIKNSSLQQAVDSVTVGWDYGLETLAYHSGVFYCQFDVDARYDYTIKIGDTGRLYKLTEMTMTETYGKRGIGESELCYNGVSHYELDGKDVNTGLTGAGRNAGRKPLVLKK